VATLCLARRAGRERELPPARRRATRLRQRIGFAVVRDGDRLLLRRHPARGLFGGLWSPPAVELPAAPAGAAATRRALRAGLSELLGVPLSLGPELASVARTLTHRELELIGWEVWLERPPERLGLRWATPLEVERLGVASAVRALMARLPPVRRRPRA
jgi:adenine-specific DNA glycosylase